jgi:hypothetical protein
MANQSGLLLPESLALLLTIKNTLFSDRVPPLAGK